MTMAVSEFAIGTVVSLLTSWVLVTRLERIGERFGLTEGLLGVLAALAADAPEITSSVTALSQHQRTIGAGVVIGSNVFNLAALLGLGSLVAGFVALHRRVVLLGGAVGLWIAACSVAAVSGVIPVALALALALVVLGPYMVVLGMRRTRLLSLPLPRRSRDWLAVAVAEEEAELDEAIRPRRARGLDFLTAAVSLVVVVLASVAMEHGGTALGHHFHVADAVIGAIVLAAVTSLPNAVAGVHLAAKGRGAAALSTTLNSNNLNVVVGLLIPGLFLGLARLSVPGGLTAWWYAGLTLITLALAFASRGLHRWQGAVLVTGFVVYVGVLLAVS